MKKRSRLKRFLMGLLAVCVLMAAAMAFYIADYYHASEAVKQSLQNPRGFTVREETNGDMTFLPEGECKAGLIFYPGGKVEAMSYAPLLEKLAQNGILCVLLEVTGNLAILELNAAEPVISKYPEVTEWYIGGHSLGGAAASMYLAEHPQDFKGIVLLGAYASADLREYPGKVLLLYGSEDGIMNRENYAEALARLPQNYEEKVLDGGIHSYFADYGLQKGDGTPGVSREKQMQWTADAILNWMKN